MNNRNFLELHKLSLTSFLSRRKTKGFIIFLAWLILCAWKEDLTSDF